MDGLSPEQQLALKFYAESKVYTVCALVETLQKESEMKFLLENFTPCCISRGCNIKKGGGLAFLAADGIAYRRVFPQNTSAVASTEIARFKFVGTASKMNFVVVYLASETRAYANSWNEEIWSVLEKIAETVAMKNEALLIVDDSKGHKTGASLADETEKILAKKRNDKRLLLYCANNLLRVMNRDQLCQGT